MYYLGLDGHDFIYNRLNEFTARFDWTICNNKIYKNCAETAQPRTICMKTDFLPKYADLLASLCRETGGGFVLLTCSSIYSPEYHYPDETRRILENPHLVAWFSENNTSTHPKMRGFPAGLNFHDAALQLKCERALLDCSDAAANVPILDFLYCPPHGRDLLGDAYCKTFCGISRNLIRGQDFAELGADIYHIGAQNPTASAAAQYSQYYDTLKQYKFLLCPYEASIDPLTPRVWEALALGVIPVMLRCDFTEKLYSEFPVCFVENWEQITQIDTWKKYRELMRASPYSARQLTADYWFERVNRAFLGMSPVALEQAGIKSTITLPVYEQNISSQIKKHVSFSDAAAAPAADTPPRTIIFAFCIYGTNPMYYRGLKDNIEIILREFGENADIFVYAGTSANIEIIDEFRSRVHVFQTGHDGVINMIYRYSGILEDAVAAAAQYYFVRDADSIIGERDLWCIRDFMDAAAAAQQPRVSAHVIRDHYHHKSKLTGGLTGFTRLGIELISQTLADKIAAFKTGDHSVYGNDETFLNEHIYPLLCGSGSGAAAHAPLVHSNFCVFPGEIHRPILARNTLDNFCGNVRQISPLPHFQFLYSDFDIHAQWKWTCTAGTYELFIQTILSLRRKTSDDFTAAEMDARNLENLTQRLYGGLRQLPYSSHSRVVAYLIECYLKLGFIPGCYAAYQLYAYCSVDGRAKELMWDVIAAISAASRLPLLFMTAGNLPSALDYGKSPPIIVYGSYADDWTAYPSSPIIHRNVWFYEKDRAECEKRGIHYEWIESDVWTNVKQIYIMGLDIAPDRIYETKQELARSGVSLDKIQTYLAKKDADKNGAYLGATKNHADVLSAAAIAAGREEETGGVIMFLEDDFVFSGDATERLTEFWRRSYDYDVCLLAASKMHERSELDDLISYSRQYCTTSSAYFVPARVQTLEKVAALVREGYDKMKETGDTVTYCIDRYWTKIQPANRMILFREKLGYQRPSMSKITGTLNTMLD